MAVKERHRKIDKKIGLQMLKEGCTEKALAERFNCSPAAARMFKSNEVKKGTLPPGRHRAGRNHAKVMPVLPVMPVLYDANETSLLESLVNAADLITKHQDVFNYILSDEAMRTEVADGAIAKRELPELKRDVKKYKTGYENMKEHAANLEKKIEDLMKGKLAQQQGDVNPPLRRSGGGKLCQLIPEPVEEDILGRTITMLIVGRTLITHNINLLLTIIAPKCYYSFIPLQKEVTQWRSR